MFRDLFHNINFWSSLSGFMGAIFIFFWGMPPGINLKGHALLVCEQENPKEKKLEKTHKRLSYVGLFLIGFSFLLQVINIILIS